MALETEKPEIGSSWTWKKGEHPWEAEVVVTDVAYHGFAWQVKVEKLDLSRFEDGQKHFELSLYRFLENASHEDR